MTRRESAIISAYTGILVGPFSALHEYIEEILSRPVLTHELASDVVVQEIKLKSKDDFVRLCESVN